MRWILLVLLLSVAVSAQDIISKGNITLLALTDDGSGKTGSVAGLLLELRPGSERVFLETFPMTKVTTQASLRFAQQIACSELEIDCSHYDFLFTIRALPGIVGGPSAGAAATLLVSSLLLNKSLPADVAMTGTINSGGTIGPVGGLKFKVEAASKHNINTVLLPKGTSEVKEGDSNDTIDLVEYGESLNLTVLEVATLGEVYELALGIPNNVSDGSLNIDGRYLDIMEDVSVDLCNRSEELSQLPFGVNMSSAENFTRRAGDAQLNGSYYAAASYCFRANVDYQRAWYEEQNFSVEDLNDKVLNLTTRAKEFKKELESREVSTLTDLQTFMAVMERVDEALRTVEDVSEKLSKNDTKLAANVGYAEERLFSALTWSRFFNGRDKFIVVNKDTLKAGCVSKISEAEERYNYVKSVIPEALSATREDIDLAYDNLKGENYIMCMYGASKSKSEANVLLSLMGVPEERFDEVIDLKLDVTRRALIKAQKKNIFPIIAYSYYEYASSLRNFDRVSALLFTEYALELANLDIYFEDERFDRSPTEFVVPPAWIAFFSGIILGGLLVWFFLVNKKTKVTRKVRSRSSKSSKSRKKYSKKRSKRSR